MKKIYRKRKAENLKKNPKWQKCKYRFKKSPRHEKVKSADRICKKSRGRPSNFDANNEVLRFCSKVFVFKKLIDSGPYYICVI